MRHSRDTIWLYHVMNFFVSRDDLFQIARQTAQIFAIRYTKVNHVIKTYVSRDSFSKSLVSFVAWPSFSSKISQPTMQSSLKYQKKF